MSLLGFSLKDDWFYEMDIHYFGSLIEPVDTELYLNVLNLGTVGEGSIILFLSVIIGLKCLVDLYVVKYSTHC